MGLTELETEAILLDIFCLFLFLTLSFFFIFCLFLSFLFLFFRENWPGQQKKWSMILAEVIHSGFQEVWLLLQKEEKNCMKGLQEIASVYLSTACLVVKVKKNL